MTSKGTETGKKSVLSDKEKFAKNEQASEKVKHMGEHTAASKKEASQSKNADRGKKK